MKLFYWIRALVTGLRGRKRQESSLSDELESFLNLAVEDKCRQGMTPQQARREALIELGGLEPTKERVRDGRVGEGLERVWQDVRFASRLLRAHPGFSVAVLLTLALGVGANSAIYSLGQAVLFRSAPVERPQELVAVWTTCRRAAVRQFLPRLPGLPRTVSYTSGFGGIFLEGDQFGLGSGQSSGDGSAGQWKLLFHARSGHPSGSLFVGVG